MSDMNELTGCGSSACWIKRPAGQANNGPCRCDLQKFKQALTLVRIERDEARETALHTAGEFQTAVLHLCNIVGANVSCDDMTPSVIEAQRWLEESSFFRPQGSESSSKIKEVV